MIIKSIVVRNLLVLRDVRIVFNPCTHFLIGLNGSGKTTLLRLLVGLAGTDDATQLISGMNCGEVELVIEDEGKTKTFAVTDKLSRSDIDKFKNSLSRRISFPITTWGNAFVSECCKEATDIKFIERYFRGIWQQSLRENLQFHGSSQPVSLPVGRGFRRAMSLFTLDSPDGVPSLWDLPESHLDISAKRQIMDIMMREERQLIVATHSPEILTGQDIRASTYDMGLQSALDA